MRNFASLSKRGATRSVCYSRYSHSYVLKRAREWAAWGRPASWSRAASGQAAKPLRQRGSSRRAAAMSIDGVSINLAASLSSGPSAPLSILLSAGEPPMEAYGLSANHKAAPSPGAAQRQARADSRFKMLLQEAATAAVSAARPENDPQRSPQTPAGTAAGAGKDSPQRTSGSPPPPSGGDSGSDSDGGKQGSDSKGKGKGKSKGPSGPGEALLDLVLENPHYVLLALLAALVVWFYRGFADGSARSEQVDLDEQERAVAPVEFRQLRDLNALTTAELMLVAAAALEAFGGSEAGGDGDGGDTVPTAPAGEFLDIAEAVVRRVRQARRAVVAKAAAAAFERAEEQREKYRAERGARDEGAAGAPGWGGWFSGGGGASGRDSAEAEARARAGRRREALRAALAMHPEAEGLRGRHHLERWALATAARRRGMKPAPVGEEEAAKAEGREPWLLGLKPEALGLRKKKAQAQSQSGQTSTDTSSSAQGDSGSVDGARGAREAMANLGSTGSMLGVRASGMDTGGSGKGLQQERFPLGELMVVLCAGLGGSVDEKADLVLAMATCPELGVAPSLAARRGESSTYGGPVLPPDYEGLQAAFAQFKKVTRSQAAGDDAAETPEGTSELGLDKGGGGEGGSVHRASAVLARARSLLPLLFPEGGLHFLREGAQNQGGGSTGSDGHAAGVGMDMGMGLDAELPAPGEVDARLAPAGLVKALEQHVPVEPPEGAASSANSAARLAADPLQAALALQHPLTPRSLWRGELRGAVALLVAGGQIPSDQRTRRAGIWPMPRWRRCSPGLHLVGGQEEAAVLPAPAADTSSSADGGKLQAAARDSTGAWDARGLHEALEEEAKQEAEELEKRQAGEAGDGAPVTAVELAVPRVPLAPLPSDTLVLSREDALRMMWTDSVCAWGECPAFRAPDFYD